MSEVFRDPNAGWAAVLVVVLPLVIIGIGEVEERLRQRDSALQRPISIVRTWVVPLLALWALTRVLFDAAEDNAFVLLVGSALILAGTAAALAAVAVVVQAIASRPRVEGRRSIPRLVLAIPRIVVLLVAGWLLIAGVWAVDLSAALTALGVTSLVVSFALQDTLGGLASGFTLLADQPFQPGDWISTGDIEGRVVDVNWRSSRIETRDGDLVVVPNGQLATATITNYDEPTRLHRVTVQLQVAYSNAPTRAKDMLLATARATPGVLEEPSPNVVVKQIDDPLMGYEVQMWIDDYQIEPRVKSDFGSLVWYHSNRFGVPLPSPAQDLYLWDGPHTAAEGTPDHARLLRAVRASPLLDDLPDDELDQLAANAQIAQFSAGETIRTEGDDDALGLVEAGEVRIVIRTPAGDRPVLDLNVGDLIGVLEVDEATVAAVAVTDCRIVVLDADVAGGAISRTPALSTAIDQIGDSRRRRIERVQRRVAGELGRPAGPADEVTTADSTDGDADDHVTGDEVST